MKDNNKLILGVGIGAGLLGAWALVELFPLIVLGGAGYLAYQGLKQTTKENSQCQDRLPDQKQSS